MWCPGLFQSVSHPSCFTKVQENDGKCSSMHSMLILSHLRKRTPSPVYTTGKKRSCWDLGKLLRSFRHHALYLLLMDYPHSFICKGRKPGLPVCSCLCCFILLGFCPWVTLFVEIFCLTFWLLLLPSCEHFWHCMASPNLSWLSVLCAFCLFLLAALPNPVVL